MRIAKVGTCSARAFACFGVRRRSGCVLVGGRALGRCSGVSSTGDGVRESRARACGDAAVASRGWPWTLDPEMEGGRDEVR
jgi:hypothetical protein